MTGGNPPVTEEDCTPGHDLAWSRDVASVLRTDDLIKDEVRRIRGSYPSEKDLMRWPVSANVMGPGLGDWKRFDSPGECKKALLIWEAIANHMMITNAAKDMLRSQGLEVESGGNQARAAELLGVHRSNLNRSIKDLGIQVA